MTEVNQSCEKGVKEGQHKLQSLNQLKRCSGCEAQTEAQQTACSCLRCPAEANQQGKRCIFETSAQGLDVNRHPDCQ